MTELLTSLYDVLTALISLLSVVFHLLTPVLPLLAWTAFWYFAVDWKRLRSLLGAGGWVVPVLLAAFAVAIRTLINPATSEPVAFGPATVSHLVSSVAWTAVLAMLAMFAGAAQVSRNSTAHATKPGE